MRKSAIGGYFELELPPSKAAFLYPQAMGFQSARAAFLALLQSGQPQRVWVPYYICGTMLDSLRQAQVDIAFYSINRNLHIVQDIDLGEGDWLLYVDYFGVRRAYVRSLLDRLDRGRLIIDSSQAVFSSPHECLATIYSPRKFFGVPDGGMIVSSLPIVPPLQIDEGSYERAGPLLKRIAFDPEAGYMEHRSAEETLYGQQPKRMSELTRRILSSVDYDETCRARNRNFSCLHERLERHNLLRIDAADVNGPLCYPLLTEHEGLRELLLEERIFVPTYWKDVLELVDEASHERFLVRHLIPLPCDQRYGESEMAVIVDVCSRFFGSVEKLCAAAS